MDGWRRLQGTAGTAVQQSKQTLSTLVLQSNGPPVQWSPSPPVHQSVSLLVHQSIDRAHPPSSALLRWDWEV